MHVCTSLADISTYERILSSILSFRVNQRYLLSGGMVLSAVFTFLFGSVGPWLRIHSIYYYVIIWGINGMIVLDVHTYMYISVILWLQCGMLVFVSY